MIEREGRFNEPVPINVTLYQWDQYLRFLQLGEPNIHALYVIDYLGNLKQARTWFDNERRYKLSNDEQKDKVLYDVLDTMYKNTKFSLYEFIPFSSTTSIEQMYLFMRDVQGTGCLPPDYIKHIFDTLYDVPYLSDSYWSATSFKTFKDMMDYRARSYFTILQNKKFITVYIPNQKVFMDEHTILNTAGKISLDKSVSIISPRVAQHYSDINVWSYKDDNLLLYCNDDDNRNKQPDLRLKEHSFTKELEFYYSNSHVSNPNIKRIHNYNPDNNYSPNIGFDIGLKIRDYTLHLYNAPCSYGRDYYLFLPYEYDPINKIIHAFSL